MIYHRTIYYHSIILKKCPKYPILDAICTKVICQNYTFQELLF